MAGSLYRCSHLASRRSQKIIERNIHSPASLHDGESFVRKHPGFQAAEVEAWATLTGDANPIHTSASAASDAGFSAPVLPGMLCASLFPAIIGSQFPGALYLTQTLNFRQVALLHEALEAEVTVKKISGRRVMFETVCRRSSDQAVLVDGAALARMRSL
ncbi:MAG: dehydratase, partial [Trebouxia sp. A1-2]